MVDLGQKGWKQFHLFYFIHFAFNEGNLLLIKGLLSHENVLCRKKMQYI
ncbi:hypothetical protein FEDK69T_07640 [Flavobacterium enshiense DK69]|nr:hypothetical protein FEDK69T_07640 [Flavobacterium enshiense DK69]